MTTKIPLRYFMIVIFLIYRYLDNVINFHPVLLPKVDLIATVCDIGPMFKNTPVVYSDFRLA